MSDEKMTYEELEEWGEELEEMLGKSINNYEQVQYLLDQANAQIEKLIALVENQ
jgi:hypothetical protein